MEEKNTTTQETQNTQETQSTQNTTSLPSAAEQQRIKAEVQHQIRIITQGAVDLIGMEDLERKLERSLLTGIPLKIKFGMDPSAPDLHLGHAVALRKLKQLQDMGHTVIIIVGDFTGKIGDQIGRAHV